MRLIKDIAVIEGDTHIARWIEEGQRIDHDPMVDGAICPLIPIGGTVIDGGANIGTHTVPYAARVGLMGFVHAFEPNPAAFECLRHNVRDYSCVNYSVTGLSFFQLLTLAFIILKLTGFIAWSWWWVLAPLWAPIAVVLLVFGGIIAIAGVCMLGTFVWAKIRREV